MEYTKYIQLQKQQYRLLIHKMLLRVLKRTRDKYVILFLATLALVTVVYLFLSYHKDLYANEQWSGERCFSELTSVKYQLNVVTEYKNRIDKLLTETQKAHESDRERFKDVMESCVAMKQQTAICQSQFEDLQIECKKVREDYNKLKTESEKINTVR